MSFGSQAWAASRRMPVQGLQARLTAFHVSRQVAAGLFLFGIGLMFAWATLRVPKAALLMFACAVVLLPLGAASIAVALWQYFGREAPLVLDGEGLRHRLFGRIGWRDVLGIQFVEARHGQDGAIPMLWLGLVPGAEARGDIRRALGLGTHGRLAIPLKGLDREPAEIEAVAKALRARLQPPELAGWHAHMSPRLAAAMWDMERTGEAMTALMARAPNPTAADLAQMHKLQNDLNACGQELLAASNEEVRSFRRMHWWAWGLIGLSLFLLVLRFLD